MYQFLCKLRCRTRQSQFISCGFGAIVSYLYYVISRSVRVTLVHSGLLRLPIERRIWRIKFESNASQIQSRSANHLTSMCDILLCLSHSKYSEQFSPKCCIFFPDYMALYSARQ